jgi:hypothetical protein
VRDEISLGKKCPDARDLIIDEQRALVVCADLPGVAILDLERRELLGVLEFPDPHGVEQPRHPTIIEIAPN